MRAFSSLLLLGCACLSSGCLAIMHKGFPEATVPVRVEASAAELYGLTLKAVGVPIAIASDGTAQVVAPAVPRKCVWHFLGIPLGRRPHEHVLLVRREGRRVSTLRVSEVSTLPTDPNGYHLLGP